MKCLNCKKQVDSDAEFCSFCGNGMKSIGEGSVDKYFKRKGNNCHSCGGYGPIKYVEFYQNIGVLVMRWDKSIKGELCKNCIIKIFWQFTLVDLFLGWWGVISFIVTPFYILNNLIRYLMSLSLPRPEEIN